MKSTFTDQAIILTRCLFRECDSLITIYGKNSGKLDLVARGTAKITSKLSGHLEPISLSDLMIINGKQFNYIGGAVCNNSFFNIKNDFNKIELAGKTINIINKTIKLSEPDENIFKLLLNYLKILNNQKINQHNFEFIYYIFILKLLVNLGYTPEFYNCIYCKEKIKPNNNFISIANGGLVCENCKNKFKKNKLTISDNCIKILRIIIKNDFQKIIKLDIKSDFIEVKKIIKFFGEFYFNLKI